MARVIRKDSRRVVVEGRDGNPVTLLTVNGKTAKAAAELRDNRRYTNDGKRAKADSKTGEVLGLSPTQAAYRMGYLDHARDSAIAYCKKKGIPSKAAANKKAYNDKRKSGSDKRGKNNKAVF